MASGGITDKWSDPSYVLPSVRARTRRKSRLRQADAALETEVFWTPTWDRLIHPQLSLFELPEQSLQKTPRKKKPKGDPRRTLPRPEVQRVGGRLQVTFPVAKNAGASPEQLEQAAIEVEIGMSALGRRQAHCGVLARPLRCIENHLHKFRQTYGCGNRYCRYCAHRNFARLFSKHSRLMKVVERTLENHPHWLVAKLDFTAPNSGRMPAPSEIAKFNKDIRRFFAALERRGWTLHGGYGAVGCNEFGGKGNTSLPGRGTFRGNTNLHAHYMYFGPALPQSKKLKELSALWSEIRGERSFVSIKLAKSFWGGLGHALKYAGKFISHDPRRLAQLEQAFYRVRRVHAFGLFYNPKIEDEQGADRKSGSGPCKCPDCDGLLGETNVGWLPVPQLESDGWRDLTAARLKANRKNAFREAGPP